MPDKLDFKKQFKDLYLPKQNPSLIDVPPMTFILVDGAGAPAGKAYQNAMQVLYALTFTIKMSKMSGRQPQGYIEYVVPPLEGLWWCAGGKLDWTQPKSTWIWTSMIRQPDFVTPTVFDWAIEECKRKKPELDISHARLETFKEGLSVQLLHIGSYDAEAPSIEKIKSFMAEHHLTDETGDVRKHHEIYLSDPRKTAVDQLKTVIRLPVRRDINPIG